MPPTVSIMIPTYNQAHYLPQAIESALAQPYGGLTYDGLAYGDLEVIVADDASTDATPQVVARYLGDARLRYVRNPHNLGRVGNYRRCLYEHARGRYVLNLDGDDWLSPSSFLHRAVALLDARPEVSLVFGQQRVYLEAEARTLAAESAPDYVQAINDGNALFLRYGRGLSFPHLSVLYRRADAVQVDFYSLDTLWSDAESFRRLLLGRQVGYLAEVVGVWRQHARNDSHSVHDYRILLDTFAGIDASYRYAFERGALPPAALAAWRYKLLRRGCYSFLYRQLKAARWGTGLRFLNLLRRRYPLVALSLFLDLRAPGRSLLAKLTRRQALLEPL